MRVNTTSGHVVRWPVAASALGRTRPGRRGRRSAWEGLVCEVRRGPDGGGRGAGRGAARTGLGAGGGLRPRRTLGDVVVRARGGGGRRAAPAVRPHGPRSVRSQHRHRGDAGQGGADRGAAAPGVRAEHARHAGGDEASRRVAAVTLRIGVNVAPYSAGGVEFVRQAERLGADSAWAPEFWAGDALTPLAFLAGQTSSIRLATGIVQLGARTPAMLAMSALSMQALSGGRFVLGMGTSGPQVMEGWHGVRFDRPVRRTRETIDIIRMVSARERLAYD